MSSKSTKRSLGANILIYLCAILLFIIIIFPFYWIICTSFKETLDIYVIPPEFFPKHLNFSNYITAFSRYNVNKLTSLVLPYIALQLPVSIILQSGYYKDVPVALEEAARLDGCSTMQMLFRIFLPLVTPGIVATGVYTFIQVWQEFLIASSLITKKVSYTLTVGLTTFKGDEMTDWGSLMATSVLIAVPALILFNLSQEFFINKVAGSVKE